MSEIERQLLNSLLMCVLQQIDNRNSSSSDDDIRNLLIQVTLLLQAKDLNTAKTQINDSKELIQTVRGLQAKIDAILS